MSFFVGACWSLHRRKHILLRQTFHVLFQNCFQYFFYMIFHSFFHPIYHGNIASIQHKNINMSYTYNFLMVNIPYVPISSIKGPIEEKDLWEQWFKELKKKRSEFEVNGVREKYSQA